MLWCAVCRQRSANSEQRLCAQCRAFAAVEGRAQAIDLRDALTLYTADEIGAGAIASVTLECEPEMERDRR